MSATAIDARAQALTSAFESFNREARSLEASYRALDRHVRTLAAELNAERALRQQELAARERLGERLAGLFDVVPGGLIVLDGAGIIREHNARAVELLNRPLHGCPWADVVRRECRPGRRADGGLELHDGRRLSLSRRRLENEPGEILLLTDVTETRRTAELLHRADRLSALGEMTAKLAHQIRTPLTSALLYAGQLERRDPTACNGAARKIAAKLQELALMVDDMLRFVGGVRCSGEDFAVADLFREIVEETAPRLPETWSLTSMLSGDGLTVRGNRAALKGALSNLVANAIEACRDPGRIELSALVVGDHTCLTVSDNGPGVPTDVRARLFEPFFTTRPHGTGLGLAVVRSVAEAHGGRVHVHSTAEGALFSIALPRTGAAAESVDG